MYPVYLAVCLQRNAEQLFANALNVHGDVVLVHLSKGGWVGSRGVTYLHDEQLRLQHSGVYFVKNGEQNETNSTPNPSAEAIEGYKLYYSQAYNGRETIFAPHS